VTNPSPVITRTLVLVSLAGSLVLVGGAQAEPYAGQYRYLDTGRLSLQGADGARWVLRVVATRDGAAQTRSEQRLYVDLDRCPDATCVAVGRWVRPLTSSEIVIDGDLGYQPVSDGSSSVLGALSTSLAGRSLRVRVDGEGGGGAGAFHGLGLNAEPPGAHPQASQWKTVTGSLRLAGLRCSAPVAKGELGEAELVDTVGDDVRDPRTAPPTSWPAGFLAGRRTARC
jgi:hypothetical protein